MACVSESTGGAAWSIPAGFFSKLKWNGALTGSPAEFSGKMRFIMPKVAQAVSDSKRLKSHKRNALWICCGAIAFGAVAVLCAFGLRHTASAAPAGGKPGMVWIAGGEFVMGTDDSNSMTNERPAHRVKLDGFWMDEHDVTNAEFATFVQATGYVTTAERKPDWEEMKKQLPPGTPRP